MRFSIRQLLGITFLTAIGLLVWRTRQDEVRARSGLQQAKAELRTLEFMHAVDDPARHQAILHTSEEAQAIRAMRERAERHFEQLRENYRQLEPRGADVLSLRNVPALADGKNSAPVLYRMLIPESRPVWLHFGVYAVSPDDYSSLQLPDARPLQSSPFTATGPFERQLPAGDHMLTIAIGSVQDGAVPVEIQLDDALLLRTRYESPNVTGSGWSRISAITQTDFPSSDRLTVLLSATLNERSGEGRQDRQSHKFTLWFSERSRDFATFPGK